MKRTRDAWIIVAIALVVLTHLIGSPRNVGPDEGSHQVASAALVRGDRTGDPVPGHRNQVSFVLPGMVGEPPPTCYAFHISTPVSCSVGPLTTAPHVATTTAQHYPPYGLLLPGLASFVPWAEGYAYLARLLEAIVPVALFAAAVLMALRRKGRFVAMALVAGATPIAWFTMSITNPSAISTAAGAGLCVGMLCTRSDERLPWLTIWSAAALMMVRRDGPFWLTVVVLLVCIAQANPPIWWWRRADRRQRVVLVASWLLAMAAVRTDTVSKFPLLLAAAPAMLAVVHHVVRIAQRMSRAAQAGVALLVLLLGAAALVVPAPRALGGGRLVRIVQATGDHLYQLVGKLGTLDASAPLSSVVLWWATVGGVAGIALLLAPRHARTGMLLLAVVITSAWVLEIGSGNRTGSYWQGRYSLPATIALPMLMAAGAAPLLARIRRDAERTIIITIAVAMWWVWNATFFAAQRRWAVGAGGSLLVWQWNTWNAPVHPLIVMLAHGVVTAALLWLVITSARPTPSVAPDETAK